MIVNTSQDEVRTQPDPRSPPPAVRHLLLIPKMVAFGEQRVSLHIVINDDHMDDVRAYLDSGLYSTVVEIPAEIMKARIPAEVFRKKL